MADPMTPERLTEIEAMYAQLPDGAHRDKRVAQTVPELLAEVRLGYEAYAALEQRFDDLRAEVAKLHKGWDRIQTRLKNELADARAALAREDATPGVRRLDQAEADAALANERDAGA